MSSIAPPFDPASIAPGTVLAGKYVIGASIGHGKVAVVYSATHRLLERKAAVKVIAFTDEKSIQRFSREARLAGSLTHENIVEVYDVGVLDDGRPFMATELLEGETLEERLEREGPLSIDSAMEIGQGVLAGLEAAHDELIVHRDLRPENIFLAKVRGELVVKILDFGISRRFGDVKDTNLTQPGSIVGEAAYHAPEQLFEDGVIDNRTDLYAMGILLYRALTNRVPFTKPGPRLLVSIVDEIPEPPSTHRKELTADVDRVILRALEKQASDRFADAASMSEALRLTSLFSSYETQ